MAIKMNGQGTEGIEGLHLINYCAYSLSFSWEVQSKALSTGQAFWHRKDNNFNHVQSLLLDDPVQVTLILVQGGIMRTYNLLHLFDRIVRDTCSNVDMQVLSLSWLGSLRRSSLVLNDSLSIIHHQWRSLLPLRLTMCYNWPRGFWLWQLCSS